MITSHKSPELGTHLKESVFKFYFMPNLCSPRQSIKWQLICTWMRICNKELQEYVLSSALVRKMLHLNWAVYLTEAQCGGTSKLWLTRRLEKRIIITTSAIFKSVCWLLLLDSKAIYASKKCTLPVQSGPDTGKKILPVTSTAVWQLVVAQLAEKPGEATVSVLPEVSAGGDPLS